MSRPAQAALAALVSVTSFVGLTSFAAPVALAEEETYIVAPGDFIKGIAEKLGVTVVQLLNANDLKFTSVIHPGDEIVVPEGGHLPAPADPVPAETPAPAAAPATSASGPTTPYVVQSGDYLFGIAADHGVKYGALLKANGLEITDTITPGQTLAIPPRTIPLPAPAAPAAPAAAPVATAASPAPAAAPATSSSVDVVMAYLQQQLGKPYKFNTAGPDTFDCSGLVRAAFLQVGVRLPHYSLLQSTYGTAVDWTTEPIRAGDLVFTFSSASPQAIGHVGIAIDSRRWIQAPGTGDVVRIGNLPKSTSIQAVRRML